MTENKQVNTYINQRRWENAFYYTLEKSGYDLTTWKKEREDFDLAKEKCPRLYVDPKLFKLERAVLARNLGVKGISKVGLIGFLEGLLPRNSKKVCYALLNLFVPNARFAEHDEYESPKKYCINESAANLWLINNYKQILKKAKTEKKGRLRGRYLHTHGMQFKLRIMKLLQKREMLG